MLREVMEKSGRFRLTARAKQREKLAPSTDEVSGVELSGDVSRLLASELSLLADEDLELEAMRRIAEAQAMSYKMESPAPTGRGPIVVCVDESQSMASRGKIVNAKAMALAMAWIAQHQNRYCCLMSFTGRPEGRLCVLPPGNRSKTELMTWIETFEKGGTKMTAPLDTLPFKYWKTIGAPSGTTDMVIITDGLVKIGTTMVERFNQWKKENKVTVRTLIIGGSSKGQMPEVSEHVYTVSNIEHDSDAVGDCLSI